MAVAGRPVSSTRSERDCGRPARSPARGRSDRRGAPLVGALLSAPHETALRWPLMSLPAGTITCVFTDMEASTALLKQLGDRYGDLLRAHRSIVRNTFSPAGGVEIDTQGDSFFFAFPRAREAVTAAIEVQRAHARTAWPGEAVVRVRIGLHT